MLPAGSAGFVLLPRVSGHLGIEGFVILGLASRKILDGCACDYDRGKGQEAEYGEETVMHDDAAAADTVSIYAYGKLSYSRVN